MKMNEIPVMSEGIYSIETVSGVVTGRISEIQYIPLDDDDTNPIVYVTFDNGQQVESTLTDLKMA